MIVPTVPEPHSQLVRSETPRQKLMADVHRQHGRSSIALMLRTAVTHRTFRPILTLRLCEAASACALRSVLLPLARVAHRITCHLACIDLPWQVRVGGGLAITHGWGLVLNADCVLGRNVTLFHGVTLGRRDRLLPDGSRETGVPTIGDGVWLGPHAILIGPIHVGDGSRVAGGSFLSADVPPACIMRGNPAVLLKRDCQPDVMNPAP